MQKMSFLDKLKKGMTEAGNKAKITVEINQIKLQIHSRKKDIEAQYKLMGETYFNHYVHASQEDVRTLLNRYCEKIISIQNEIEQLQEKIKEISNEKSCVCGQVVPRETKFCPSCGHKFDEESNEIVWDDEPQPETVVCASCHSEMAADSKFCPSCGQPVNRGIS